MSFSFTRPDTVPERALADLSAAFEMLAAAEEVEQALDDATERLKQDMSDEAYDGTAAPDRGATRIEGEAGTAGRHRLSGDQTIMAKNEATRSRHRPKRAMPR